MPMSIQRWEERSMAPRFNPFDNPNALPPGFMGGVAGNPSDADIPAEDLYSGYVPLPPVVLGGVDGSLPVRNQNSIPQSVVDFYGGILNIGQPDATYFEDFPLPGTEPVQAAGPTLPVAAPTYVTDTRPVVPREFYDPKYYMDLAESLSGGRNEAYDDTEIMAQLAALQGSVDALQVPTTEIMDTPVADPLAPAVDAIAPPLDAGTPFVPYDDSYIMDQLAELRALQDTFITAEDLPVVDQYDDAVLRNQMLDLNNRIDSFQIPEYQQFDPTALQEQISALQTRPTIDTSQFLTAADLPTFEQFDPSNLQSQINELQSAPAVDTSQFLTAADLPTYDTSALEQEIAELRAQLNRNTVPSSTPELTTPTFEGILPTFGGFNVR